MLRRLACISVVVLWPGVALAANRYVDNSISAGANDGTSWANAWHSLSAIAWGSIAAGDTIYVSGGTTSQTYLYDNLVVGSSGSTGNPITITDGRTQGKPGTVIIDGTPDNTGNSYPIDTNDQNNLIIQNFTVQNSTGTTIWAHGSTSGTVTIQNIISHQGGNYVLPTASFSASGQPTINFSSALPPYVQVSSSVYVQDVTRSATPDYPNNYIVAMTSTSITLANNLTAAVQAGDTIWFNYTSAHGIEMSFNAGNVVAQNIIHDTPTTTQAAASCEFNGNNTGSITYSHNVCNNYNGDPSGHSDCMFSDCDRNVTMDGNYCSHPNGGTHNHGMIMRAPVTGYTWLFKNNIFYLPDLNSTPDINVWWDNDSPGPDFYPHCALDSQRQGVVKFYNNTVYGGLYGVYFTMPNSDVKNNIIVSPFSRIGLYVATTGFPTANSDYNVITGDTTKGNLWATACGGNTGAVRGTQSHASGKYYYEFRLGVPMSGSTYTSSNSLFGIGNASAPLNTFAGSDLNGVALQPQSRHVFINGGWPIAIETAVTGDIVGVAVDLGNKKIWWKNWTSGLGWNNNVIANQNPVTNTGGLSLSNLNPGPYYVYISFSSSDSGVLNAGGSAFTGTMPSGYSAWGGTFDPAQIGNSATLSSCPVYSNDYGYLNLAGWQGHGYDTHSLRSDPKLANPGLDGAANYALQSGSPAIDAGATISGVTTDYNGTTRPQGAAYDIGAFEFVSRQRGILRRSSSTQRRISKSGGEEQ